MVMSKQAKQLYEFGPFSIDAAERVLMRNGQPVALTPKAFDLLLALVQNSGHLLEKDELMQRLWPEIFVEEANLSNNISLLRKALGDDTSDHQYIETVPRRGYRFVAQIAELSDEPSELVIERRRATVTVEEENSNPERAVAARQIAEQRKKLVWLPLLALAVLPVIAFGIYYFWPRQAATLKPIKTIAVLPFKPLTADSRNELFEMGMSETLIARLSGIREMVVRPLSAVRRYQELEQDPIAAGRELKVDAVLDGTIQTRDERVRVTARLIKVSDGQTLWADKFDAPLADIFTLQDSISERVATAMAVNLSREERQLLTRHYTDNTEAYQLYLKGRLLYRQWTEESIQKALECFDRAIAIDSNYALAYAGQANVYSANSSVLLPPAEAMPKAREAAEKALEIDGRLAEAHYSMARVKQWADWDWSGAESEFKRALELKSGDAEMHANYSEFLIEHKRFDEALAELRQARELDPVSFWVSYTVGRLLYLARQYEQALTQSREVVALYPNSDDAHRILGCALRQKGMHGDAIAELQKAVELHRTDRNLSELGHGYALAGRKDEAKQLVKELEELSTRRYVSPVNVAKIYAGLEEKERMFEWLHKGYADRSDHLLKLGIDPAFDSVRSDPRFQDLLRRVGLEQ
jgi:DNA-binding winged helix-turn-helix (wHTH) protein/TolB-like protein/Flp pilus assembly protein TadD